jgi:chemotaxis protein CheX
LDPAISPSSEDETASISSDQSPGTYCLPQVLDLTQARELREQMIARLRNGTVAMDAGAVERMSTPCLQVLLAGGHAAEAANSSFRIINASASFRAAVEDLGLRSQFTNWMSGNG